MQSKHLTIRNTLRVIAGTGLAVTTFTACGVNWEFGGDITDAYPCMDPTYSDYHSIRCVQARCKDGKGIPEDKCPDAGSSSSSSSGSSARCTCVPNAPDGFRAPQPVYVGPSKPYPPEDDCPPDVGSFGDLRYTNLLIPSPGCPECICGPIDGTCSPTPDIALNADLCNGGQSDTTNFAGPADWDGSCTTANAVPANLECPPGSGVPCAQSIMTSPLPAPLQACKPVSFPVPKATGDKPAWRHDVLSCSPTRWSEGCAAPESEQCLPALPQDEPWLPDELGWRYCVRHEQDGVHTCPSVSQFKTQILAYLKDSFVDTRACTACSCEPSGGTCYGTLRVYNDDACSTNELLSLTLGSDGPNCQNFFPPGEALSSKEITDLVYVPGTCAPKGGEPIGSVEILNDKDHVVTWCCMPKDA